MNRYNYENLFVLGNATGVPGWKGTQNPVELMGIIGEITLRRGNFDIALPHPWGKFFYSIKFF